MPLPAAQQNESQVQHFIERPLEDWKGMSNSAMLSPSCLQLLVAHIINSYNVALGKFD